MTVYCATCGTATGTDGVICPACGEDQATRIQERVAKAVREEREACAVFLENQKPTGHPWAKDLDSVWIGIAKGLAKAIRARGDAGEKRNA